MVPTPIATRGALTRPLNACARALLLVGAALALSVAQAAIVTSGSNFSTGVGTPTLQITAPITFTVTATSRLAALVFDEWVTADAGSSYVVPTPVQFLAFELDGVAGSLRLNVLSDNVAGNTASLTPNDGLLVFRFLDVNAGQTLTILPQTFTFEFNNSMNPNIPTTINGKVFLAASDGRQATDMVDLAAPVTVPEPASLALVALALAVAGGAARRRTA